MHASTLSSAHRGAVAVGADESIARDVAGAPLARQFRASIAAHGALPQPGQGRTLQRWRALCDVARIDLSLAKLFESHHDALAILDDLDAPAAIGRNGYWAVWAAEHPSSRVEVTPERRGSATLNGTKFWCSGAGVVDHALVTCWRGSGGPYLGAVDLRQPGVSTMEQGWHAIGMADTRSQPVVFEEVVVHVVGDARAYVDRSGFWQGGAGIAACWYGGALALAEEFAAHFGIRSDVLRASHLGSVDVALRQSAALLRETARLFDEHPRADARLAALRVRASVEAAALKTLEHAGNALGASAYCLNARFARFAADLPVFLRQSHGAADLASLGASAVPLSKHWGL